MRLGLLALFAVGCLRTEAVTCADGRTCPAGTVCDEAHALCVQDDQLAACASKSDGDACKFGDTFGLCDRGTCLPATQSWTEVASPWVGRREHASAFDVERRRLIVLGGYGLDGVLADHWERTTANQLGTNRRWERVTLATMPPARFQHVLAYDPVRRVTVLFGGTGTSGELLADTWQFDGTRWIERATPMRPPARANARMVYDEARSAMVLFGGRGANGDLGDTWSFDGTSWTPVAAIGPAARHSHAMAYDSIRDRLVVFGGASGRPAAPNAETWELTGTTWTRVSTPVAPGQRFGAAMMFSSVRNKLVLFGGLVVVGGINYANDTWEYDGSGWTQVATTLSPPGRAVHALALDPLNRGVVLTGGTGAEAETFDDIWEYTELESAPGAPQWVQHSPLVTPTARYVPLVHDEQREELVAFAGLGVFGADVWTFDGDTWSVHFGDASAPASRASHAASYDRTRGATIVFGGEATFTGQVLADTWAWNGSAWSKLADTGPPPRRNAALAFDAKLGVTVMFGGDDGATLLGDTWELDGGQWRRIENAGGPRPQSSAAMGYDPVREQLVLWDGAGGSTYAYRDRVWTQLELAPSELGPRGGVGLTFDPDRGRIVLYGGSFAGTVHNDLWELTDVGWQPAGVVGPAPPPRLATGFTAFPRARALVLFGGIATAGVRGDLWMCRFHL